MKHEYWYEKYIDNKIKSDYSFVEFKDKFYEVYETCSKSTSSNSRYRTLRWYNYIKIDDKFVRLNNSSMRIKTERFNYIQKRDAKIKYPEYFI